MTFRKRSLTLSASAAIGVVLVAMGALAASNVKGLFFAAIVLSLFAYLFWLVGWQSAVRLDPQKVTIDNLLVRHVIPWPEVAEIGVGHGMFFRLSNGQRIGTVTYGGSVLGALLQYRYTRRVVDRIIAERDKLRAERTPAVGHPGSYWRGIQFSPWPPLVILAAMEAIASLSLLTR